MPNACKRCLAHNLGAFHRLVHNLGGIHRLSHPVAICIALILQGVTLRHSMQKWPYKKDIEARLLPPTYIAE